jgi:hypothetical protein
MSPAIATGAACVEIASQPNATAASKMPLTSRNEPSP